PHVVRSCSFARRGGMRRPASIVILTRFDGGVLSGVCARREPCRVVHEKTVCGAPNPIRLETHGENAGMEKGAPPLPAMPPSRRCDVPRVS
ncbi:hypothetical protein, partial [Salmonella enterica]|uniref:hypothetical protein n=1 Tax=Salmonella enterica TaxID=28901 RepID=UPI00398C6A89